MVSKLPSEQLADLMDGRVTWDDTPASIRSWAQFYFFNVAKSILKLPKEKRRSAIDKAPEGLRPMIEAEIIRVYKYVS